MKITIELSERDVLILASWASVSRTLNTAKRACEDSGEAVGPGDVETYHFCGVELEDLTPALDTLHRAARDQIWAINKQILRCGQS